MKKRFLSLLITGVMVLSLLAPAASAFAIKTNTASVPNWDSERYGDRVDIDGYLNKLSESDTFMEKAEADIKAQAENINFNEDQENTADSTDSTFTYDGGTKYFLNIDTAFKPFTLRSVGDNVEVWVANDLSFPEGDPRPAQIVTQEQVDKLRDEFDSNIYPVATEFFGMPDVHDGSHSPLVDWGYFPEGYYETSDKIVMLVDNIKDENYYDSTYPFFVAGFFWGTLESYIDRNIITIDTNNWEERLENTFFGTTIHELQHLIHADNDSAEETWINEGMSTFSEYLGGYGHGTGSINFYLDHPENSLVNWDDHRETATGPETIADYGQVYLFTLYLYDKFGKDFIRELATSTYTGIDSVNAALQSYGLDMDFTKVYQNFMIALALDTDRVGNGDYSFDSIDLRELPVDKAGTKRGITVNYEKAEYYEKEGVPAWGSDYKVLDFAEKIYGISFDGVDFLPVPWLSVIDPLGSDNQVLWGNNGDELDNGIIFNADLTGVETATLQFDNYIDIEEHWDFGVVQVSTDGGQSWTNLENENTSYDVVDEGYPKIKENLPGFTGHYEDWQQESFDLTAYAGQDILIAFRYLTDWGYNDAGWFVDNIEIPEIGYYNDGASTDGFLSMNELLGQYVNYTVTFINELEVGNKKGTNTNYKVLTVDPFDITEEDALEIRNLIKNGELYMITSYAAPANDKNPVEFSYEVKTIKDLKDLMKK